MPGKTTWFPLACYSSHPSSCTGQVAKTAACAVGCLPAQGRALSWAVPPSWAALTEPPLPLMSRSTLGLSPAHSPSHVCPSHQQHSLTIPPPMCDFSVSSSSAPSVSLPPMGQTRALGPELQSGLPCCWGSTLTQPPSLASSALTDFLLQTGDAPGFLAAFQSGELFRTRLE